MNKGIATIFILFIWCASVSFADASWLIDAERFHMSVHGQLSCLDCHEGIAAKEGHPDPLNVNRSIEDFFDSDTCFQCHDDIEDDIESGGHGGEEVMTWESFNNCIACHNPHEQLSSHADINPGDVDQQVEKKCGLCHDFQGDLPELTAEDQACMTCHQAFSADDPKAAIKTATFCFHCHGAESLMAAQHHVGQPFINSGDYEDTPHAEVSCLACHPRAAAFEHSDQPAGDCGQCHVRHHEKVIQEAHASVSCEACHLWSVQPRKDRQSGRILWERTKDPSGFSRIHFMPALARDTSCMRCHFSGNTIGASAMVLPAKSIICMPCHTATFSVGDTTTILSLVVFIVGFLGVASVWFSGKPHHKATGSSLWTVFKATITTIFSSRVGLALKALILDGIFQRRLYRISHGRWTLHAMIFYPFIFRFVWGIAGLVSSLWWPESTLSWVLVDKNHPMTAFMFDLSGIVVIMGVIGMIARRVQARSEQNLDGYPPPDWLAYALLGGIMLVGFLLEGMRMAMTGSPGGASWAFAGYLISRILTGMTLTNAYGYVWYLHAILTGVFVAYLPFSRMFHMIMSPAVLVVNAAQDHHQKRE